MSWVFTKILSFLSGGFLDKILGHLSKSAEGENVGRRIEADMMSDAIRGEIAIRHALNEQMRLEHGWWVTKWIRPLFVYPIIIYQAAIIADSLFDFEWDVLRLPATQENYMYIIIGFYFGGRVIEKVARIIKA